MDEDSTEELVFQKVDNEPLQYQLASVVGVLGYGASMIFGLLGFEMLWRILSADSPALSMIFYASSVTAFMATAVFCLIATGMLYSVLRNP